MRLGLNVREATRNYYAKWGLGRPGYQEIDNGSNAVANGYLAEQQGYVQLAAIARDPARAADKGQAEAMMAAYEKDMADSFGHDTTEKMLQMYYPERAQAAAAAAGAHYGD